MKRFTLLSVISMFVLAAAVFAQGAGKEEKRLSGKWVAVKKDQGLPKLEITGEGDKLRIHAWGKCEPQDCDWGVVVLHVHGDSVSARELGYGFASWDQKFKVTHMTLHLQKNELIVETYNIFNDNSGRSNYRDVSRFKRTAAKE